MSLPRNIACQARSVKLPSKRISRTNKQKTFSYKTKPEYWMEKIVLKPTWISKHNTKPFLLIRYLLVFDAHLSLSISLCKQIQTHTHNVISSSIMYIEARDDDDDDSAESMPGFKISSIPKLSLASLFLFAFQLLLPPSLSLPSLSIWLLLSLLMDDKKVWSHLHNKNSFLKRKSIVDKILISKSLSF